MEYQQMPRKFWVARMVISLSFFLLALSFSNEEISNANKSWSYSSLNFQTQMWNLCYFLSLSTCFIPHLVWCPVKVHSYWVWGYSAKKIKIPISPGFLFKDLSSDRWFSIISVFFTPGHCVHMFCSFSLLCREQNSFWNHLWWHRCQWRYQM